MIANRVLDFLFTILAPLVLVVQIVTTFLLGILVSLSFGLLLFPISFLWMLQFGFLLSLSWLCNKLPWLRNVIGFLGIPFALFAGIFVSLMPSMGEVESRAVKLLLCESWPFTWEFWKYQSNEIEMESREAGQLQNIIARITRNDEIKQRVIQRIIKGEQLDAEVTTVKTSSLRHNEKSRQDTDNVKSPRNVSLPQIELKLEEIKQKLLSCSSEEEKQSLIKELKVLESRLNFREHKRETDVEVIRLELEQDLRERNIWSGGREFFPAFKDWFSLSANNKLNTDEAMISYCDELEKTYNKMIENERNKTTQEKIRHNESTDDTRIHFRCPHCQAKYSASRKQKGKKGDCKTCGKMIEVPTQ